MLLPALLISKYRVRYRKEVKVGEQTILLAKLDGSFYATSGKCTHYGAPLVKGSLASDGRIMW